jgi:hypothetical protein
MPLVFLDTSASAFTSWGYDVVKTTGTNIDIINAHIVLEELRA